MKRFIAYLCLSTLFIANASAQGSKAESGKAIFKSKNCVICHKLDVDTIGPSLQVIARAYLGKEMSLVTYLKGQGTPIVDPARASVMNPQLVKIRILRDEDMHDLANYIVSSNDRPF